MSNGEMRRCALVMRAQTASALHNWESFRLVASGMLCGAGKANTTDRNADQVQKVGDIQAGVRTLHYTARAPCIRGRST